MFEPCLELPSKRKKAFDSSLCIVCQKAVEMSKRGRPSKRDASSFDVFITVCQAYAEKGNNRYDNIYQVIKGKTSSDLEREGFCFHASPCRSEFQRLYSNLQRKSAVFAESTQKELETLVQAIQRLSRLETACFDKNVCLFCQGDWSEEALYSVRQTSRDQTLKDAFLECPASLALYKIRSSHAFDAMAGDIKYHKSCWRDIIDKRVPELEILKPSSSKSEQMHNDYLEVTGEESSGELSIAEESMNTSNKENSCKQSHCDINNTESPDVALKEVVISEIIEGTKVELRNGRAITLRNLVDIYKSRIAEHGVADTRTPGALRNEMRRIVTKRICEQMDGVVMENAYEKSQSQRIIAQDLKAFALKYAEENASQHSEKEIAILTKASSILRRRTLQFMKDNPSKDENFKVAVTEKQQDFPPELTSFVEGFLFGHRKLDNSQKSEENRTLTETVVSAVLHNIKTDRQVAYDSKRKSRPRHAYTPQKQVALALAIRHCERNNAVLELLSAPNFGVTITPRACLVFETMIANAMTEIAKREGVYIPPNIERGVRMSFHIDNFDEQVHTFDGKNTVHYLLIVCFQRRYSELKPIELNLKKTNSLTLNDNSFGELLPCEEPTKRQFRRTPGCMDVKCSTGYMNSRSPTLFVWQCLRAFEHLFVNDETATYVSGDFQSTFLSSSNGGQFENCESWKLNSLNLPSFSATNSLVVVMDTTFTNIFPLPFVAGPASSTPAVYTALDIAFRTSEATASKGEEDISESEPKKTRNEEKETETTENATVRRALKPPPLWKTIIVLDLDLYAKAYKLVNSRSDLRDRYVLCLGELHIIFAEIRAIGTFINSSGLDDAWMGAHWFDSESLLRQVKECVNMKRAVATHEATFITITILLLQATLRYFNEYNWYNRELFDTIMSARDAIKDIQSESEKFKEAWNKLKSHLSIIDLDEKIKEFVRVHKNNRLLQFLMKYCDMVTRLITFIEATRSRNWLLHLDALEDMIPDFASMNRINYRRLAAAYVADMRYLEINDRETWNYFMEGNFCCQKSKIPFTAIGRDHCGEQENKVLKGRGGVSGQTSNSNSTNRYFMTAPILSQIFSEMLTTGGVSAGSRRSHHQLGNAYTRRQNEWIISLLRTFEKQNVSFLATEETSFCNMMTGQVFSDAIYHDMINAYETGQNLYNSFVEERLKPDSNIGIFAKLKKSKIKTCKSANKGVEMKYKDKVAILKEENIFISRLAMIRGSRDVDMKFHIGNHELTPIVYSLMKRDGTLLDGWDGKSKLGTRICSEANVSVVQDIPFKSECVAIDSMFIMNQISTKPSWVRTGSDLAREFCNRVDQQSEGAQIVIAGFEWYSDESLKSMAWKKRHGKEKCNDYNIEANTDISKRSMKDILGTTKTKKSLTTLLMNAVESHLKARGVEYFVAGNGVTKSSYYEKEKNNNHTEGETVIIHGLSVMDLHQKRVTVYGSDVDLFVLLLAHYNNINCEEIHMKSLSGYTSITAVHDFLGPDIASAVLSLHALTGCDTTGKFSGKSKEFWTGKFLSERNNSSLIQALKLLQSCQSEEVVNEMANFICRSYCPKKTPKRVTDSLVETRYFLYKKFSSETNKLPPSPGAFLQHVKRACCQLVVWSSANLFETGQLNHFDYGWEDCDGFLMPVCTRDDIAPADLAELVSCNCGGDCTKNWCTCLKNKEACTDLCGCGDECMNTDMPLPESVDDDDDVFEELDIDLGTSN